MDKSKKKTVTIIAAIVLSLTLITAAIISYASFTNSNHAQRTIATYEKNGIRFSSNYLASSNEVTIYTLANEDESKIVAPSTVVSVCNYEQGKQNLPYENDIYYTFEAKLVKKTNGGYVDITASDLASYQGFTITVSKNGQSAVLGKTAGATNLNAYFTPTSPYIRLNTDIVPSNRFKLTKNVARSESFQVEFTKNFVTSETKPNIYLYVAATPYKNAEGSDRILSFPTSLSSYFKADIRTSGETSFWSGSFHDATETIVTTSDSTITRALNPSDYDGYNYRVEGVGSGTFTLQWDTSKVQLSFMSLQLLSSVIDSTQTETDASGITNKIVLNVNSDETGVYDLQFYKTGTITESWEQMAANVVQGSFR